MGNGRWGRCYETNRRSYRGRNDHINDSCPNLGASVFRSDEGACASPGNFATTIITVRYLGIPSSDFKIRRKKDAKGNAFNRTAARCEYTGQQSKIVLDPGTRSRPDTFNVTPTASDTRPLRSGELARRAGVSPDTLRHYERRGLLPRPERSAAGYRLYSPEALRRVRLIRGALSIGFTVNELGAILADRDHGRAPCRRVRALAANKLAAVERQLRTLRLWRRELRTALADWDRRLRATPRGKRADCSMHSWLLTRRVRSEALLCSLQTFGNPKYYERNANAKSNFCAGCLRGGHSVHCPGLSLAPAGIPER